MAGNNKLEREFIYPRESGPAPVPMTPAVRVGSTLYISGTLGVDPVTYEVVPGGIIAETEQIFKNFESILSAAGIGFSNSTFGVLYDINEFGAMNEVYKKYFTPGKYPARAAYQIGCVPKNCRVEIEAVAVIGEIHDV